MKELIQQLRAQLGNSLAPIGYDDFVEIIGENTDLKRAQDEAKGKLGAYMKAKLKEFSLNKSATGDILKLKAKSSTERADYLRTYIPLLLDQLEFGGWGDDMTDLVDQAEDNDDE